VRAASNSVRTGAGGSLWISGGTLTGATAADSLQALQGLQGRADGLLQRINALGIGPAGFGGRITTLAVHVETAPCHIASLPVAVSMQCHSCRRLTEIL
jgi:tartrate dehydratase alpha subunit/fumarate hydratase class I-like protein